MLPYLWEVVNRVNRQFISSGCAPPPDGACGHGAAKEPAQSNFKSPTASLTDGKTLYIADRTNARIRRFNLDGSYIGEWNHLGRPFAIQVTGGALGVAIMTLEAGARAGDARCAVVP